MIDDSKCKLFNDDCLNVDFSDFPCDFIYMDPPYGPKNEDSYYGVGNNLEEYVDWLIDRIKNVTKNKKDFNLVVHVDQKCGHYVKVALDSLLGRSNFKNEIIWCFSGPSNVKTNLPRKHNVLYWYGVGNNVFNPPRTPYTAKLKVGGKTSWAGNKKDEEEYLKRGKLLEDWWIDIPALQRNEKEKLGYATQKPVKLMIRLIEMLSNEEKYVIDPMCGSGSIMEACVDLKRKFIGCDYNKEAIELVSKRYLRKTDKGMF